MGHKERKPKITCRFLKQESEAQLPVKLGENFKIMLNEGLSRPVVAIHNSL